MSQNTIKIVEISRGTTHDGPGLRTTVFTKGCVLACRWCQNPESISPNHEVWYEKTRCIGCLLCVGACPHNALDSGKLGIGIHRGQCTACGTCAGICPAKALTLTGMEWSMDDLVREVIKDKPYYGEFGGGVTVSGGEPLIHGAFLSGFFAKLREHGIHVALDTCACLPEEDLIGILPLVDAVLYDIKLMDTVKHMELTGRENQLILNNLLAVAAYIRKGAKPLLWIRTPLIPGATATEDNIGRIADFITGNILDVIERWELCAFNPACAIKYNKMQKPWMYEGVGAMKRGETDILQRIALSRGIPETKLIVSGIITQDKK